MRGRPAKSITEKLEAGTFRAGRENVATPQPSPFDASNPFDQDSHPDAWRMWEYVVPELIAKYSVGKGDYANVEAYCRFYDRALKAAIEYGGSMTFTDDLGNIKLHPALKVEETSWDRVKHFGALLGLDPINRNKIRNAASAAASVAGALSVYGLGRDRQASPTIPMTPPGADEGDTTDESEHDGDGAG